LFLTFTIVGSAGNEPVLKMTTTLYNSAGAMFWSETYSGGAIKITILGTQRLGDWNAQRRRRMLAMGMPAGTAQARWRPDAASSSRYKNYWLYALSREPPLCVSP